MDKDFIADCLKRYCKHLADVKTSIEKNIDDYNRQLVDINRLASFKPQVYEKRKAELEQKIVEADIKLSHIVPRMERINEQIPLLINH